jgi:hypothetical protein
MNEVISMAATKRHKIHHGGVLIACMLAGITPSVFGQIEIALQIEPTRAVLYEPVNVKAVIYNNTGGILTFDGSQGSSRFFFEVERGNYRIKQTDRTPLLFKNKIIPFEIQTNFFQITSLCEMQKRGRYKIKACLEWQNTLFVSSPVEVEILKGAELARIISGIPADKSAIRVYILEYLSKNDGEKAYLRIEDEDGRNIFGMFNLGNILRSRKPEMKVDESGNVHVLFQSQPRLFIHTAFTPYGVQLFSKNYSDTTAALALTTLPNGHISVSPPSLPPPPIETEKAPAASPEPSTSKKAPQNKPRLGTGGLFGPKPQ